METFLTTPSLLTTCELPIGTSTSQFTQCEITATSQQHLDKLNICMPPHINSLPQKY